MTRYKIYFERMLEENKEAFEEFRKIHKNYSLSPEEFQDEFNKKGEEILAIIHEYENRLCANQERGIYNKFSATLAEKFQNEVRRAFPLIDHVGLKNQSFQIKKINLP